MTEYRSAILALADGKVFRGHAFGHTGHAVGEVCFNTSMTGYQEILTDPSYTDQIITFTYPHIGNVGCNEIDVESSGASVKGAVIRQPARITSNYRASSDFETYLKLQGVVGITGIDTRALTRHLRLQGAVNGVVASDGMSEDEAINMARAWAGLEGRDLVSKVSTNHIFSWKQGSYNLESCRFADVDGIRHIVAFDFGCKRNIFRKLADRNCRVTVVPVDASAEDILSHKPDGIFLSNGPGDPAAVAYAAETIRELIRSDTPIFGICMGHQLLSRALGMNTFKLKFGHRGGNHPVRDEETGKIEITSQNHGFAVRDENIPDHVEVTHRSLFDGTIEGIRVKNRPVFSVQYHPEASPGPHDADYLFDRFMDVVGSYSAR
ncbi:MAG: glutamine-hydrolyzing carbamoyl-phosphate synthase small subunit [Mariprofundaceae bacterium]